MGSPPHMRGKEALMCILCDSRRITHAHAGKSEPDGTVHMHLEDHPPHMWGKGSCFSNSSNAVGITPAHAGKRITCFTH